MRVRAVAANLGTVVKLYSIALLLPILPALVYEADGAKLEVLGQSVPQSAALFASLFVFTVSLGVFLERVGGDEDFREAEGFALVGLGYLVIPALGSLPFLLTGAIPNALDAYFESMSGFATVGATVIPYPIEAHPPSIVFWRSLTHWLGGMGIIVLGVALLPKLVESGASLMRAEFSGGGVRLRPKLAQTARSLWAIYFVLTIFGIAALALALLASGMAPTLALFEAVNHGMSAIATGGFSTRTASVGAFNNPLVEAITIVLMVAGASSFILHYRALHGEGLKAYRDEEFVFFGVLILALVGACAVIVFFFAGPGAWASMGGQPDPLQALRYAAFNVVSVATTTGFATADYDAWPDAARILLIVAMITGGMVGSTTGGIKAMRILVLAKLLHRETLRIVRPRAVLGIRVRGSLLGEEAVHTIAAFFFAFITVALASTIILTFTGLDIIAAFTASVACLSTLGPALGPVVGGPDFTYAALHPVAKAVLVFDMWFGRLEIFAALLLFLPSTWRR